VYANALGDVITIFYQFLTKFDPTVFSKKNVEIFLKRSKYNFLKKYYCNATFDIKIWLLDPKYTQKFLFEKIHAVFGSLFSKF